VVEGAVRRATSREGRLRKFAPTNAGIKLRFVEWLTSKKAGFGKPALQTPFIRIAVRGVVDIEEGPD